MAFARALLAIGILFQTALFAAADGAAPRNPVPVEDGRSFVLENPGPALRCEALGYGDSVAVKGLSLRFVGPDGADTLHALSDREGRLYFEFGKPGPWRGELLDEGRLVEKADFAPDSSGGGLRLLVVPELSIWSMVFAVLGGLGVFLLGMHFMSSGLQTVAGAGLRRFVAVLTSNRFFALLVGAGVTGVIQSSSITTVMVVGFVNSGLMQLEEAVGVVIGANLGTTVTLWLLALAVDKWGLPILGAAAFVYLFGKREKVRYVAMAVMGVGMIFFGMELMKNGVAVMREMPSFVQAFSLFAADGYAGVMKLVGVGILITMVVQASSATIGMTIALASQGVIDFPSAAALALGAKIGTTITAFLASLGANVDAKRCAYFHTFFNLSGVLVVTAFFPAFLRLVVWTMRAGFGVEAAVVDGVPELAPSAAGAGVAAVSTVFYVLFTIVWMPFTRRAAALLRRVVPDRAAAPETEAKRLAHLDNRLYDTPLTALTISRHELAKMGEKNLEMMDQLGACLRGEEPERNRDAVFAGEGELDVVEKELTEFVAELLGEPLGESEIDEVKAQLRMADEYETISDYLAQLLKFKLRLEDAGASLSDEQLAEVLELHDQVRAMLLQVASLSDRSAAGAFLPTMETLGRAVTVRVRQLRDAHWERLSKEKMNPLVGTVYGDLLSNYRKIKDHLVNVVEARAGLK